MRSRPHLFDFFVLVSTLLLSTARPPFSAAQPPQAQAPAPTGGVLTVERIYSQPSLSGHLTRGIAWTPDGKKLSFFRDIPPGRAQKARSELWIMDATSGQGQLLLSAEKLETVLPAETEKTTQATGLGRRAPSQYQWAPDGSAILFQSSTALAWFDLKTETSRALLSGKETIADAKISPDGLYISFVRGHNLWLVSVSDGKQRRLTQNGTEEIREGELDWVYPEELDIKTAYWWSPDSSAVAYLEMDERKVSQYPLVNFSAYDGEAEMERYPVAGGANPVVRVLVASVKDGEPRAMDTGAETDHYIPRVDWLNDSKHLAIQRLNRQQTVLELLIADADSGKSRIALTEKDQYWINVSDDLYFFKDGKRFLWSSERSGYRHLYLYGLDGKQLAQLTKGDWEVSAIEAVDESKGLIYFTATEKSALERQLYRVALDGTGFARVTKEDGTHHVNIAPKAAAFVDTYSNSMAPPRQDLLRADGSRIAAINENKVAELAEYRLSPVEFLTVKSHDGMSLNLRALIRRKNILYSCIPTAALAPRWCSTPGGAARSYGMNCLPRRATSSSRSITGALRDAGTCSKSPSTFAWAHKKCPTSGTAPPISNRFLTLTPTASAFGAGVMVVT